MLGDHDCLAIIAVSDIELARQFYGQTLGLDLLRDDGGRLTFKTGSNSAVIYVSDYAGTNQANALVWGVGDQFTEIVAALKARGVAFEHYPGMEREGDIHRAGAFRGAWFKDPDGNILHLNTM